MRQGPLASDRAATGCIPALSTRIMAIREGAWQSKNDHDFILQALRSGRRADGRRLGDTRLLRMVFARAEGQASAEIQLGRTRVLGVVAGEVPSILTAGIVVCCGVVRAAVECVCVGRPSHARGLRWRRPPVPLSCLNRVSHYSKLGCRWSVVKEPVQPMHPLAAAEYSGRLLRWRIGHCAGRTAVACVVCRPNVRVGWKSVPTRDALSSCRKPRTHMHHRPTPPSLHPMTACVDQACCCSV